MTVVLCHQLIALRLFRHLDQGMDIDCPALFFSCIQSHKLSPNNQSHIGVVKRSRLISITITPLHSQQDWPAVPQSKAKSTTLILDIFLLSSVSCKYSQGECTLLQKTKTKRSKGDISTKRLSSRDRQSNLDEIKLTLLKIQIKPMFGGQKLKQVNIFSIILDFSTSLYF